VSLLRPKPEIDPKRIYVLGHSLGAMAAPFIAARDGMLAGIILMAGNARSALALVEDQIEYLAAVDGGVTAEERAQIDAIKKTIAGIRAGNLEGETLLGAPALYWARIDKRDQVATAAGLSCPILILQGGRDYQVSDKDFAIWKERLGGRKNVAFRRYPALNHLMMAGKGASRPREYQQAGHVDPEVISDIVVWIAQHSPDDAHE